MTLTSVADPFLPPVSHFRYDWFSIVGAVDPGQAPRMSRSDWLLRDTARTCEKRFRHEGIATAEQPELVERLLFSADTSARTKIRGEIRYPNFKLFLYTFPYRQKQQLIHFSKKLKLIGTIAPTNCSTSCLAANIRSI